MNALLFHGDGATRSEAVRRWVDGLPPSTGDALTTAALIGQEFDIGVLGSLTRRSTAELIDIV